MTVMTILLEKRKRRKNPGLRAGAGAQAEARRGGAEKRQKMQVSFRKYSR
jgi:hypothetical protein